MITPRELDDAKYNCLAEGTPVVLADGSTALIENLVRRRMKVSVLSQDAHGRFCAQPIIDWHKQRVPGQEWLCVRTDAMHGGHRGLVLTPEHQVFTTDGRKAVEDLKSGMRIYFPEAAFAPLQMQAVLGTLLGATRLTVSPVHRKAMLDAPNFALDGGHSEEHKLAQYKVRFLAPHAQLGVLQPRRRRLFRGKETITAPFQPWCTPNLHQLKRIANLFYYVDGSRKLSPDVLTRLGALGLAWWFMDDGCRQNVLDKDDTVTLALCRYAREDVELACAWFAQRYGKIYMGADQVLRFSRDATVHFCNEIAPYVIPQLRYKLPHGEHWPKFCNPDPGFENTSTWTTVTSVKEYKHKTATSGDRLGAETRFCITVAKTHRFFTSFGLVKNCRDVLGTCRVMPHLTAALARMDVENVYCVDEELAELALQMTRIGLPVNSARRAEIGARLYALRDEAVKTLRPFTEGTYREPFLTWVATFFAVKPRNGEPVVGAMRVGPTRAQAAVDEIIAAQQEWRAHRKELATTSNDLTEADAMLADLVEKLKVAKRELRIASFDSDANDGLVHTTESASAIRVAIRRADAELAIAKKGVNFGAKIQQAAILRAAGVPIIKTTGKSGMPKIDKEVLESFSRHPAAKALLRYTLTNSTINVYIEGEKRAGGGKTKPIMVTETGYIHPQWICHKISGRWGSSPNVQNWSRRAGGGAENLRAMIEAPEGYKFVGADFAQLEARLVGAMAQCRYLLDVFAKGEDVHGAFAVVGFPAVWPKLAATFKAHKQATPKGDKCKCETCAERDKIRDLTKRMEYGGIYGGSAKTIWESIVGDFPELTQRQVQNFLDSFNTTLPEVLAWRQNTLNEAIRDNGIRSPILGRWQVFPLGHVDPTVAYNFKAQSGGADLWALGALDFMALYDQFNSTDVRLIHNGHDSVLVLCLEELAKQVARDVNKCWDRTWGGVPFFMETKIGKRWSET